MKKTFIATLGLTAALLSVGPSIADDTPEYVDAAVYPDIQYADNSEDIVITDSTEPIDGGADVPTPDLAPTLMTTEIDIPIGMSAVNQEIAINDSGIDWSDGSIYTVDGEPPAGFTFSPSISDGAPSIIFSGTATEENVGDYRLHFYVTNKTDAVTYDLGVFTLSIYN